MGKEFDFDDIGKRLPYQVPNAYFKELEQKIADQTGQKRSRNRHRWAYATTLAAAAVLAGLLFLPIHRQGEEEQASGMISEKRTSSSETSYTADYQSVEQSIEALSDEELEEMVGLCSADVFLY